MDMSNYKKFDDIDLDLFINQYHRLVNKGTFDDFWEEIKAFAEQNRISTEYVEDEFIIDGEFLAVHLKWHEDDDEIDDKHPYTGEQVDQIIENILKEEPELRDAMHQPMEDLITDILMEEMDLKDWYERRSQEMEDEDGSDY